MHSNSAILKKIQNKRFNNNKTRKEIYLTIDNHNLSNIQNMKTLRNLTEQLDKKGTKSE